LSILCWEILGQDSNVHKLTFELQRSALMKVPFLWSFCKPCSENWFNRLLEMVVWCWQWFYIWCVLPLVTMSLANFQQSFLSHYQLGSCFNNSYATQMLYTSRVFGSQSLWSLRGPFAHFYSFFLAIITIGFKLSMLSCPMQSSNYLNYHYQKTCESLIWHWLFLKWFFL